MRRTPRLTSLLLSASVLALAGCTGAPGTGAGSPPATPSAGGDSPAGEPSGTAPEPAFTVVGPEEFARDGAFGVHVFESPSGNLACGIDPDGATGFLAGCHARETVENLPACDDPDANGPWAAITREGVAEAGCQREGVFFDPAAQTLEYGQALEVGEVRCESSEQGVTCSLPDGTGFSASRAEFAPVG